MSHAEQFRLMDMERTMPQTNLQIGLIATDPLRILGLQAILSEHTGAEVLSTTVAAALESREIPLLVIDAECVPSLLEVVASLRRNRPEMRLVVLGGSSEPEFVQRVIGAGAKGYLSYDARESDIRMCIEVVRDGSIWAPRRVLARLIEAVPAATARAAESKFTDREGQVLKLLIEGRPNREIASMLGIDEGTVKAHISRLMRKVGVGNRTALTMHYLGTTRHLG